MQPTPVNAAFSIGCHPIGPGHPCFVIAEIAQAHDGSLGMAHAYIDAAAQTGVQAVKFQTHIAAEESTLDEPWRVHFSRQDANRYAYWKRMEFTPDQWRGLAEHAKEVGLIFLSSPFSCAAVRLLDQLDMPAWKVASGEIQHLPLLQAMTHTRRPILLSTGLCTWSELDAAVACIRQTNTPVGIFECTTAYPCPAERVGLASLAVLRERYGCPVGLSDHSSTIYAGIAAATLGANLIEAHLVFSRDSFGPDARSSLLPDEFKQLVTGVRFVEKAIHHTHDKSITPGKSALRDVFGRSIALCHDLPAGHVLQPADLTWKKPGTGIPPHTITGVIGRRLRQHVYAHRLLKESDLEEHNVP